MTRFHALTASASLCALALAGCGPQRPPAPLPPVQPPVTTIGVEAPADAEQGILLGGQAPVPSLPGVRTTGAVKPGDIRLNFPQADIAIVAKAVLGDLLHIPYSIAPGLTGNVSLVTPAPVARASVFGLLEDALRQSGFALVQQGGGYVIMTVANAQASGLTGGQSIGYGTEVVPLQFINGVELKKLLDTVVPGVAASADIGQNSITIAGTSGQRAAAHDIIRQFDVNWLRNMSFAYFTPSRTDARLIVPELDKLINADNAPTRGLVRLISMERLNGIIAISAQRQYLEDVRRWIDILDREGRNNEARIFVYRVQNGRSRDLAKTLNAAFNGGSGGDSAPVSEQTSMDTATGAQSAAGASATSASRPAPAAVAGAAQGGGTAAALPVRITSDEVNNAVIVFGTPRDYAVVEEALRKLDVAPYQVMIEAAISEVTLNDDLRFGVQWNFQTGSSNFSYSEGTSAAPTRIFPGFSYFLSNSDINATLNALEARTNVKVVSAPKLLVLNNQTAALQVGDQVPITTASAMSTENATAPIVNSVEYRDTGVILKVTPRVNEGGLVLLDIAQEVSDVNTRATSTSPVKSPVISTRRVSTSIAVQDNQVIALGGLFRDSRSFGKNGLPILSRIPVLGALFGTHENAQGRTELIVLLKPHVLRTADDARAVTEELRSKLRTLEPFRTEGRIP